MSLQTEITSDLAQVVRDLRNAETRADDKLRAINVKGIRKLLAIARGVVHVKSGRLQSGLVIDGPFNIGTGTLEAKVYAPSVPYAGEEIKRGGAHDFASRTLEEGQGAIDETAQEMERALIAILEGRA